MGMNRYLLFIGLMVLAVVSHGQRRYQLPKNIQSSDYEPNTIVLKILPRDVAAPQQRIAPNAPAAHHLNLEEIGQVVDLKNTEHLFPEITTKGAPGAPGTRTQSPTKRYIDHVYKLELQEGADLLRSINELLRYDNVVYAEPLFYYKPLEVPDDPEADPGSGGQTYLSVIKAYEAWDIEQGNENIIIGISDTGVELNHDDLKDNLAYNTDDPVNGLDDDGDGYVDNYRGWDFADNDNDPSADANAHGTVVAGISSAEANNQLGIAGVGYNSRYVPLKIFKSIGGVSNNSFLSVAYAGEKGFDVINLSWGAANAYSSLNQDVINTAVLRDNMVVVAAAGNTNAELDFYPASYDNVISVAAGNMDHTKAGFATYSYHVDLIAPGVAVYSTQNGNAFGTGGGSSFATPQVAGAAALVRAKFPSLTAQQVMEQLRVTGDEIYDLTPNIPYTGQLGRGSLNVYRALTDTLLPAVRVEDFEFSNKYGPYAFFDDTVNIGVELKNYLYPTTIDAEVTLSSPSPYVTIIDSKLAFGTLATLRSFDAKSVPFQVHLDPSTPANERLVFRLDFKDGDYEDFQYIQFRTSPDYIDLSNGLVGLTIGGEGSIGENVVNNVIGDGLVFNNNNLIRQTGLILRDGTGKVVDNVIADMINNTRNRDFKSLKNIRFYDNSDADHYAYSVFTDENGGANALDVVVEQKIMAWDQSQNGKYYIVEYRISNIGEDPINGLDAALFSEWSVSGTSGNRVIWDGDLKMGYAQKVGQDDLFSGIALLSNQDPSFHALDLGNESGNTADLGIAFSKPSKGSYASSGVNKTIAGAVGSGNHVGQVLGGDLGSLNAGGSVKIVFAFAAGISLEDLKLNMAAAAVNYQGFLSNPPLGMEEAVCMDESFTLSLPESGNYALYKDPMQTDLIGTGNDFQINPIGDDTTFYYVRLDSINSDIMALRVDARQIAADFITSPDTLFLGDDPNNAVQFTDQTADGVSWYWDFGNGNASINQHPKVVFTEEGTYDVTLNVVDAIGCRGSVEQSFFVTNRGPAPTFGTYEICKGESVIINSQELNTLRVYDDHGATAPLYEGKDFNTGALSENTTYWLSNLDGTYESLKVPVEIEVIDVSPEIIIQSDSIDLSSKNIVQLSTSSVSGQSIEWLVNGDFWSNDPNPTYQFNNTTDPVVFKLTITNERGCEDETTRALQFYPSNRPQILDQTVCPNEAVVVTPTNGNNFLFYSDVALTNLIAKGRTMSIPEVSQDTVIFVTGYDGFIESNPESVRISVRDFEADFVVDPPILVLRDQSTAHFISQSEGAASWRWLINDELMETVANPLLTFDSAGVYEVRLIATSSIGCEIEVAQNFRVLNVTAVEDALEQLVSIYPNPVADRLQLKLPVTGLTTAATIVNALGQHLEVPSLLTDTNTYQFDVSGLQPGLYFMKLELEGHKSTHKFIVR